MKEYAICKEKKSGIYSIRVSDDCSYVRFDIINSFHTFEEANEYLTNLLHKKMKHKDVS